MNWHLKIDVRTPFGHVEQVGLEDCLYVYQRRFDSDIYVERADGVDGVIDTETLYFIYDNYPEIINWRLTALILYERSGADADAIAALRELIRISGDNWDK